MTFITMHDKTELYVKDWGTGRPVIMTHGWPLSADSWDDVGMAIADAGFRAIACDRRGFGRSGQPWDGYDYNTLADDLRDVIKATGAKDATLIGFSMGGGEVARYLSRHQGKHVAQVALVSSVVPFMLKTSDHPSGTDAAVFAQMARSIQQDRAHFFAGFFRDFFGADVPTNKVSQELLDWARMVSMQASLKATLACAHSFSTTDFRGDLAAFTMPTLIIHGTADKTVPIAASAREAKQGIPHAKLLEYEGAPHGLFATHRQRLIEDVLEFLRAIPAGAGPRHAPAELSRTSLMP